ncbi:MAG: hypothetical protein KAR62_03325 [Sphingomonadales bacterium]|nr:hypothetical protein [Sphingomonadales bacterium]
MFLITHLKQKLEVQDSMFESQLLREDIARLEKLVALIKTASNLDEFKKAGMVIGWTKGDLRTFELKEPLEAFINIFFEHQTGTEDKESVFSSWQNFNQLRRKVLLHCL